MKLILFLVLLFTFSFSLFSHSVNKTLSSQAEMIMRLEHKRNTLLLTWPSALSYFPYITDVTFLNESKVKLLKSIQNSPADLRELIKDLHQSNQKINDDLVDILFGINYYQIENIIPTSVYEFYAWINQPKEATQTSYDVAREMFRSYLIPTEKDTIIDLGSGYGRILLYGAILFPKTQFVGIELVEERSNLVQNIAKYVGLSNVKIINKDIREVDFSHGTHFYLFNPFPPLMNVVLDRLHQISLKKKISIITTGVTSHDLLSIPWLKKVKSSRSSIDYRGLTLFESK